MTTTSCTRAPIRTLRPSSKQDYFSVSLSKQSRSRFRQWNALYDLSTPINKRISANTVNTLPAEISSKKENWSTRRSLWKFLKTRLSIRLPSTYFFLLSNFKKSRHLGISPLRNLRISRHPTLPFSFKRACCSSKERLPAQRSLARSASPPENRESSLVFIEKHRLRDRLPARMHRSVEPCINEDAQQPLPPFATYSQDSIPDSRISYTVGESASSPAPRSIWR